MRASLLILYTLVLAAVVWVALQPGSSVPWPFAMTLGSPGSINDRTERDNLVTDLAYTADGSALIARQEDGTIVRWEIADGSHRTIAHTEGAFAYCGRGDLVAFSAGGETLLIGADGAGQRILSLLPATHASFDSRCETLALAGGDEQEVVLWRLGDTPRRLTAHTAMPVRNGLAMAPDGTRLAAATGTYDHATGHVTVTELFAVSEAAMQPDGTIAPPDTITGMWHMAFADGNRLILGTQRAAQSGIGAFEPEGQPLWRAGPFRSYWVRAFAVSPDGARIVTGDEKGFLRLWDAASGDQLAERKAGMVIQSAAFAPAGHRIAIGLKNGTIAIVQAEDLGDP